MSKNNYNLDLTSFLLITQFRIKTCFQSNCENFHLYTLKAQQKNQFSNQYP